jgi:hypothetical protein
VSWCVRPRKDENNSDDGLLFSENRKTDSPWLGAIATDRKVEEAKDGCPCIIGLVISIHAYGMSF